MRAYRAMLARLGDQTYLSKQGYIYEPKLDGIRALCFVRKKLVFINRNDITITNRYPEFQFRKNIKADSCVLDGEIIVYNKRGKIDFQLALKRDQVSNPLLIEERSSQYPATFVVFDILMLNGKSLLKTPLLERKKILKRVVKEGDHLELLAWTPEGKKLWREIKRRKMEGVIAKKEDGLYYPGARPYEWIKIKSTKDIDCVIIGFSQKRRTISALALAVYNEEGKLQYVGKVGTGFSFEDEEEIYKKLSKITVKKVPVEKIAKVPAEIQWVKPKYIAEIKYLELTKNKHLRAPVFIRLRSDKKLKECVFGS